MRDLRYTLLCDGSTDRALLPILEWLLRANGVSRALQPAWADLGRLRRPPKDLPQRITVSIDLYPCDLLFVHRDAEKDPLRARLDEIQRALAQVSIEVPVISVVPVRMQEAWLLFDAAALRRAAGNPLGKQQLVLPKLAVVEALPDPKNVLHTLLREASGLSGRRLAAFSPPRAASRLAELIEDYAPLRALPAFQHLEEELVQMIQRQGWDR